MNTKMISVVVPVMNEAENISRLIPEIYALPYTLEILLVDTKDGSTDNTEEIVENYKNNYKNLNLIRQAGSGFANALIEGLKAAKGDVIVTMDAENHLPGEIPLLIKNLQDYQGDVIVGSRFFGNPNVDLDKKRFISSKIANKVAAAALDLDIKDCSSGFRAYKASTVQNVLGNMRTQYFSVQVEILDRIKEAGGKLMEMSCTYTARKSGESKYKIKPAIKDGVNILRIAGERKVKNIKEKYNLKMESVKEKAGGLKEKTEETPGNVKEKFKDMKIGVDKATGKVKSKGKDIFKGKFKDKFKKKFK